MRRPATFRGITARSWDTRECYLAELCQRVQEKTAPNLGPVFPSEILESQGYSSERGRLRHHQTREPKRETPMQKTLRTRGKSRRSQTHFRRDPPLPPPERGAGGAGMLREGGAVTRADVGAEGTRLLFPPSGLALGPS